MKAIGLHRFMIGLCCLVNAANPKQIIDMQINIHQLDALLFTYFWADILTIRTYHEQNSKEGFLFPVTDVDKSSLHLEYAYNPNPQKAAFYLSKGKTQPSCFPIYKMAVIRLQHVLRKSRIKAFYARVMDDQKLKILVIIWTT